MVDLMERVDSYLRAEGFAVGKRGRDLLVGSRRGLGPDVDQIYVWVPTIEDPRLFQSREGGYLSRFKEVADSSPGASKYFIVPSLEGLTSEFRQGAPRWYNVRIRTPVQFFDTDFKWEASREAPSAAKDLKDRGADRMRIRIPQPYEAFDEAGVGADLLDVLIPRLKNPASAGKPIQVVVGPAGIGKSYLFDTLFATLHDAFMDHKQRGGPPSPRPLPLLPDYVSFADATTVKSLLTAFLQTDFARPLRREVFEWMLLNSYGVWMLDGLDEVIRLDPQFFEYLEELITTPGVISPPSVLICIRDSLLQTNEPFREFLEECQQYVAIYRLRQWDPDAKRQFARNTLGNLAEGFLQELRSRPSLDGLASTPYYCSLLADEYKAEALASRPDGSDSALDKIIRIAVASLANHQSETSILSTALTRLIERDYEKAFVDKKIVTPKDIIDFYEVIATENYNNGFHGVPVSTAVDWANIVLAHVGEEQRKKFAEGLVNLGVFSQGTPGHILFAQEIMERYLLGCNLVSLFESQGRNFGSRISVRELPPDWLTVRMLADHIDTQERLTRLIALAYEAPRESAGFRNILQIATIAAQRLNPEGLQEIRFEKRDLSGLKFIGLDLHNIVFRDCNLTDVVFEKCNLQRADFTGAILQNTAFVELHRDALRGAKLGDLTGFFSMRVGRNKVLSDPAEAYDWMVQQTGERSPAVRPCPSALQLRYLFNKFVKPDGTGKRHQLARRALLSGKRIHKSPEDVLETVITHGYLVEEDRFRDRIRRAEGDRDPELVAYATSLKLSPGLRAVLDDMCEIENCPHIPPSS